MFNSLRYFVTGPSLNNEYGIAVMDLATQHSAVTMQFLKRKADADHLVVRLNEEQVSVSVPANPCRNAARRPDP